MTNTTLNKVIENLDYVSWRVQHSAQDWQMGITQRYYAHVAADRAWRVINWLDSRTQRFATLVNNGNRAAYDRWVLTGRAWERHLDRTIGRDEMCTRFFLAEIGAPQTTAETEQAKALDLKDLLA